MTLAALLAVTVLAVAAPIGAAAATPKARTSLTAVWNDLMCPSCHEPLSVAQSPQAIEERQYVQHLVTLGYTKAQVEREMVAQYGPAVLGKPPASGFNLTVYVLPPALLAAGVVFLLLTLPKWRARARAAAGGPIATGPALSPDDERRLDADLARFK